MVGHEVGEHYEQDVASNSDANGPAGLWSVHLVVVSLFAPRAQVDQRRAEPFVCAANGTIVVGSESVANLPTGLGDKMVEHRMQAHWVLAHRVPEHERQAHQVLAHRVLEHQVPEHERQAHRVLAHRVLEHRVLGHQVPEHERQAHQVLAHRVQRQEKLVARTQHSPAVGEWWCCVLDTVVRRGQERQ